MLDGSGLLDGGKGVGPRETQEFWGGGCVVEIGEIVPSAKEPHPVMGPTHTDPVERSGRPDLSFGVTHGLTFRSSRERARNSEGALILAYLLVRFL